MIRKVILLVSIIYFIILGALGFVIYQASPGPASQEIFGIGISDQSSADSIVYLSGRRLSCFPLEDTRQFAVTCSVELAGHQLEVQARRNTPYAPNQLGGICQALYNGQSWPCTLASRHVNVNWYAYLPSLGLSSTQLASLRYQYPVENQPETVFLISLAVVPLTTAVVVILLVVGWDCAGARGKKHWMLKGLTAGVIALIGTSLVWFSLTNAFWD